MSEKTEQLIGKILFAGILTVNLLLMFVINPGGASDKFVTETLWEAVHPFHPFFDTIAFAANIFLYLYLAGVANKVVKPIYKWVEPKGENSIGATRVAFWICVGLMFFYYI